MDLDIDIKQDRVHITIMGPIDSAGGAELSTKFTELAKDPSAPPRGVRPLRSALDHERGHR